MVILQVGDPIVTTAGDRFDNLILPRPLNSGQCNYQSPVGTIDVTMVTVVIVISPQGSYNLMRLHVCIT